MSSANRTESFISVGRYLFTWKGLYALIGIIFIIVNLIPLKDMFVESYQQRTPAPIAKYVAGEVFNANYQLYQKSQKVIDDKGMLIEHKENFIGKIMFYLNYAKSFLAFILTVLVYFGIFRFVYLVCVGINDSLKLFWVGFSIFLVLCLAIVGNIIIINEETEKFELETFEQIDPISGFFKFFEAIPYLDNPIYVGSEKETVVQQDNNENIPINSSSVVIAL